MIKKRSGSRWSRLNQYVNENFKLSLNYLKKIRNYIFFSFLLFLIIAILGFQFPIFFRTEVIKLIAELIKKTEGLGTVGLIRFIIANNIQSAFFGMALGIFLGIMPLIILVINGYILGFVASETSAVYGSSILWRLLPHGIFEIPAIMIAVGLGLRLGMFLFISKKKNWGEFRKWVIDSLRVFILIVIPLLVLAGIIEGILIFVLG